MSELRIGTSGWMYDHWRGRFYPTGLPKSGWLGHYASVFDTVELNNPFYRQPARAVFERWRRAVPADFTYAVKLNRFLTHIRRLRVEPESVERAYGTMAGLGPKLAVVLVQLPPRMKFDPERVEAYFRRVGRRRRRHAIEPRDASWLTPQALALLRRLRVALCLVDAAGQPAAAGPLGEVTSDLVYVRFHGREDRYSTDYSDAILREWAARIAEWRARDLDVYVYFNNDGNANAPKNALRLRELCG